MWDPGGPLHSAGAAPQLQGRSAEAWLAGKSPGSKLGTGPGDSGSSW